MLSALTDRRNVPTVGQGEGWHAVVVSVKAAEAIFALLSPPGAPDGATMP